MFFPLNKRPTLNRLSFLLLFSVYIAVFLNLAFYHQVIIAMPLDSVRNWLVFLSMPLVAMSVINIVVTIASFIWLDRVVIALFILVSAAAQYFIWNYGVIIDRSMLVNILDTTPSESLALMTPQLVATLLLSGVVMAALAFWVRVRTTRPFWKSAVYRIISVAASVICILLVASLFYKDYASLFRNQKELVKALNPSNSIAATLSWYKHNRDMNLPLVKIGEDAHMQPAMQTGKKNLTILIVGETSRAADFSLSGYDRETNPLLKKDDVTYFPHTASCGTATAVSVPCMFSGMPRAHYDDALAGHQEGLLDVIQRAGIKVLWNDNDGGCKGACDRVPHQDVSSLNLAGMCIKGECYDEVLFHGLEAYIQQLQGNGVIVLHTIGSHGPTYYNRYPPQFRRFTPTCDTNQIQDCSQQQLVNTYDNTLLYVDFIVDKAIKLLQAHQDRFTTSLVYLSDHGESLGEHGMYLHGAPYLFAPSQQTHIPLLLWMSDDYARTYGINQACLRQQAPTAEVSQDNLFHTLLGMFNVQTREYQPQLDMIRTCRKAG